MKADTKTYSGIWIQGIVKLPESLLKVLKMSYRKLTTCEEVNYLIEEKDGNYTVTLNTPNFHSDTAKRLDLGFLIAEVAENLEGYEDFSGLMVVNK